MRVERIIVGERARQDLGDIDGLAASMAELGQLQPIAVTAKRTLIAGERRLMAARRLGWTDIAAHIVTDLEEAAALLKAERDENTCRKPLTPTEEHSLYEQLLALEEPKAKERMSEGARVGKVSTPSKAKEAASEAATGSPGRHKTLDKVGEVKQVADDETKPEPVRETARQALTEIDETGKVDGAYQQVKKADKAADLIAEFPELEHYSDRPEKVIDLGQALLGYDEPERTMRRENLAKAIAAEQRRPDEPKPDDSPNHYLLAQDMFYAANEAAKTIRAKGGADTFTEALANADPVVIENWENEFASLAMLCRQVASVCRPQLRSVK